MDDRIIINSSVLKFVLNAEARKIVGKLMKRFETIQDTGILKKECKELIYESYRDLYNMFLNGKILFSFECKGNIKKE